MPIQRSIHETNGRQGDQGQGPLPGADPLDGTEPLRLPAHHKHLVRVFHGARPLTSRLSATRSLTPAARRAIRERLLDGTYSAPHMLDELARRLLASSHL